MLNKLRYYIFLSLLIIILSGCDDNYVSSIPNYPVNLKLDLTSADYSKFKYSAGQYHIFAKPIIATDMIGFGGVLVTTGFDENYYAFDLACPYEAEHNIKVKPNDLLGQVKCETCGTVYDISYGIGNPIKGPSKEVLKRYKTILQGDWLSVFN